MDNSFGTKLYRDKFLNIAKTLPEEKLKEIGKLVVETYQSDLDSRQDWEAKQAKWSKLYAMQREPKNFPFKNCSNMALPVLAIACIQYQARAFEALIPSRDIVREVPFPATQDNIEIAERKGKYLNYHLLFKDQNFKDSMDKGILKQGIEGMMVRKVYYDAEEKSLVSDFIETTDFIVSSKVKKLKKTTRCTHRLYMTGHDIQLREKSKIFINTDKLVGETDQELDQVKEQHLKNLGLIDVSEKDEGMKSRLILEQHCMVNLDGKSMLREPVIVFVDYATETVLRIESRRHPETMEILERFTVYPFLPNPSSFYSDGFGLFLEPLNEAENTIINQLIDSGTLQNLQTGFIHKKLSMKRGSTELSMGKFTEIVVPMEDLKNAVIPLKFGAPSQVLYTLLGVIQNYSDRITTVTEQQTGNAQKSDTTATGVALLIEQGLKFFSAVHKRNHNSFQRELRKLERLCSIYTDFDEYAKITIGKDNLINPQTGEVVPYQSVIEMCKSDFDSTNYVEPVSNPNITSMEEKVSKAEAVYNITISSPITSQNIQSVYSAQEKLYKALGLSDVDIQGLLSPVMQQIQQSQQQQQLPDLPQEEENEMFLNEKAIDALETQNHEEHLQVISDFEKSPFFEYMTPTGKKFFEAHKRQHIGFLYIMTAGTKKSMPQQLNSAGVPPPQVENSETIPLQPEGGNLQ